MVPHQRLGSTHCAGKGGLTCWRMSLLLLSLRDVTQGHKFYFEMFERIRCFGFVCFFVLYVCRFSYLVVYFSEINYTSSWLLLHRLFFQTHLKSGSWEPGSCVSMTRLSQNKQSTITICNSDQYFNFFSESASETRNGEKSSVNNRGGQHSSTWIPVENLLIGASKPFGRICEVFPGFLSRYSGFAQF